MNQKIIIGGVVFLLITAAMFGYAYYKKSEMVVESPEPQVLPEEDTMGITRIDGKHFFRNGTHTVTGEILMPTPCDLLEADAVVRESMPEQVTLVFSVINNSEMCAQVVTPQRFKVEFSASEEAQIDATFKGSPVILNLIEAGPNENPDDFEVFIKG